MKSVCRCVGVRVKSVSVLAGATLVLAATALPAFGQLTAQGNHRIFQDEVGGAIEAGDRFGNSLVVGNFDGDQYDDLAIGAPNEAIGAVAGAGAVFVVYGSAAGLGAGPRAPLLLHQDVVGVAGAAETNDHFGTTLASGDFNGDGNDELVVGVPDEDVGALGDAGAIQIFLGTAGGMITLGDEFYTGSSFAPGAPDTAGHRLGAALATGHLSIPGTDSRIDLLIGVPGGPGAPGFEGVAIMVAGSFLGLDPTFSFVTFPGGRGDAGDRIGAAVAVGDTNNDGVAGDVVLGAPFAELGGGDTDEGVVWIVPEITGEFQPIPLAPPFGSHFGTTIVCGDFINEGYDQILIGAPETEVNSVIAAGAAIVYDEPRKTFKYIVQNPDDFFARPDPFDNFGRVLAVGDFDADSHDDAAFGVPNEDLDDGGVISEAGIVQIAYGSDLGLTLEDNQLWALNGPIGFSIFANDNFGGALAAGDFNGDGVDDLAIGVPGAVWLAQPQTGFVQILYGVDAGLFADGFGSGGTTAWSNTSP